MEPTTYLPSKPVRYIIAALAVGFLLYLIIPPAIRLIKNKKQTPYRAPEIAQISPDRDTDGDGVPDWQEILVNLNPKIADTDNDGISDRVAFEERKHDAEASNLPVQELEDQGTSGKLGLIIAEAIAELPVAATQDDLEQTIQSNIAEYLSAKKKQYSIYTDDSVESVGNTKADVAAYHQAFMKTFNDNGFSWDIVFREFQPSLASGGLTAALAKQQDILEQSLESMVTHRVPSAALEHHIALMNTLAVLDGILEEIDQGMDDPTDQASAVIIIQETARVALEIRDVLNRYFIVAFQN